MPDNEPIQLVPDDEVTQPWFKLYQEKILSSQNLQELNFTENSLYLQLLIRVRPEGKYIGMIVYPDSGKPVPDENLAKAMKLKPCLFKEHKKTLIDRKVIKIINGAIYIRKFKELQRKRGKKDEAARIKLGTHPEQPRIRPGTAPSQPRINPGTTSPPSNPQLHKEQGDKDSGGPKLSPQEQEQQQDRDQDKQQTGTGGSPFKVSFDLLLSVGFTKMKAGVMAGQYSHDRIKRACDTSVGRKNPCGHIVDFLRKGWK